MLGAALTRLVDAGMNRQRRAAVSVRVGPSRELPQLRTAPAHVLEGLRRIDPGVDLLYVARGRWRLVSRTRRVPTRTIGKRLESAERLLATWETPRVRANPGAFLRLLLRYEYWLQQYRGITPIAEYQFKGEPTSAIVDDFRYMDWKYRHTSDAEVDRELNADKELAAAEAHAELTDPHRAVEAWRFAFVRTHGWEAPNTHRARSGFTLHQPGVV